VPKGVEVRVLLSAPVIMKIQTSTDWVAVESKLNSKCRNLIHGDEVKKMIRNITSEITKLSKAEVQARQGRKGQASELLMKINQDIEMVEEYLLVAAIIG
jgi:hypothetical protein